jgi:hypothetical protein
VEKVENPDWREAKLPPMSVLKVDIVEMRLLFVVEIFDPVTVEKLKKLA